FDCANACCNEALAVCGKSYRLDELMQILIRDSQYWGANGGVTFGGGDPLYQADFVGNALKQCKQLSMHTAVETSAHGTADKFLALMECTDWAFIDIKHMDSAEHKKYCGAGNELILSNIKRLKKSAWKGDLVIRIPVITGYNDSAENMGQTAQFLKENKIGIVNILSFHNLGISKYKQLGLKYKFGETPSPSKGKLAAIKKVFEKHSIICYINHDTAF
ncbi:MAG: glycyl-radical enzyme activating protein, partial [Elusimicrobia bacterium]|nr:glycyl-radical enzyme activating protein [Elusimicrobiota bacterium]